MSRETQLIAGAVLLAVVGGLAYNQVKKDSTVGTGAEKKADLPDVKAPDEADKLVLNNGDKGEIVLEKKGDKWELTKPVAYPANQQKVKQALDDLKKFKVEEVISSKLTDDLKKTYELDDKKGVHLVAFKGGEKKFDVVIGKSGTRGQMASIAGKDSVYAINKDFSPYSFTVDAKSFRDNEIFKFEETNATSISIVNKTGSFSFTKGDKWAASFKDKPIDRFDEAKVGEALRSWKALTADDFGDGKTPAETGLDAPEAVVTVALKDQAGKYTLKLGKVSTGTSRYAQKDGSDTVFVISSWPSEWATSDLAKWQRPADAGASKDAGKGEAPKLEMPEMPGMPGMVMFE
jgi:Domain of unknown function (DUF4340)